MKKSSSKAEGPIAEGAGFGIRTLSQIIDMFYGFFLGLIGGVFSGILLMILQSAGLVESDWADQIKKFTLLTIVISFFGSVFYHTLLEGIHGATLGKMICGLRVLRADGHPCDMRGAMIRNLTFFIDSLFFGLVGYQSMQKSALRQRYGDVWAGTVVVQLSNAPESSLRSAGAFMAALALGSAFWIFFLIMAVLSKIM